MTGESGSRPEAEDTGDGGTSAGGAIPAGEGFRWSGDDPGRLDEVIEAAFDYRGDVTLHLASGGDLEGYLFDRCLSGPEPHVILFPKGGEGRQRVVRSQIRGISFTGKDTASGKSWEAWVARQEAKKAADRERDATDDGPDPAPGD